MSQSNKTLAEILSEFEQTNTQDPTPLSQPFPSQSRQPNSECTKNGLCKKFIHGKCQKGDQCSFSHDEKKMKPCHHFLNNSCTKGEDCDFSHTKDRMPPCRYLMYYGECTKKGCPFKHVLKMMMIRGFEKG